MKTEIQGNCSVTAKSFDEVTTREKTMGPFPKVLKEFSDISWYQGIRDWSINS